MFSIPAAVSFGPSSPKTLFAPPPHLSPREDSSPKTLFAPPPHLSPREDSSQSESLQAPKREGAGAGQEEAGAIFFFSLVSFVELEINF